MNLLRRIKGHSSRYCGTGHIHPWRPAQLWSPAAVLHCLRPKFAEHEAAGAESFE